MAKTKISEFDVDPSNNTDINSINIAEGCAPSGINNAIRQLMSDLKEQQTGASGDNFTVGGNLAVTGTSAFTGATTFTGAVVFSSAITTTNATLNTPTINSPTINSPVIVYEGATANDFETTLAVVDPTADRTLTFPDKTGTVAVTSDLPSATALFTSSGTYAIAGSTSLVVTSSSHGRAVGDVVYLDFTSGGLTDGYFTITAVTTDTLTVTYGSSETASGNVTGYYSNLGLISIASTAETIAGTSTDRAVTPAGVTEAVRASIVQGTSQASTSGTSIDFTGIPSWVKRVTVLFNGVSLSGNSSVLVQLGAGSVTTTGYSSASGGGQSGGGWSVGSSTDGLLIRLTNDSRVIIGSLCVQSFGNNGWVADGTFGQVTSTVSCVISGGSITLGGTLDRLRITTENGTDTFDAGSINIMYE
jgi:hypothetical protein